MLRAITKWPAELGPKNPKYHRELSRAWECDNNLAAAVKSAMIAFGLERTSEDEERLEPLRFALAYPGFPTVRHRLAPVTPIAEVAADYARSVADGCVRLRSSSESKQPILGTNRCERDAGSTLRINGLTEGAENHDDGKCCVSSKTKAWTKGNPFWSSKRVGPIRFTLAGDLLLRE